MEIRLPKDSLWLRSKWQAVKDESRLDQGGKEWGFSQGRSLQKKKGQVLQQDS